MLLYTVCFTPKGKDPATNKYVDMLFIWLRFLQKYGSVTSGDTVAILVDKETLVYIRQIEEFKALWIPHVYVEVPQPETVQKGAGIRYTIYNIIPIEDDTIVCYCDIDMLVIKDVHWIEETVKKQPNDLHVYPEYTMVHYNYLGDPTEDDNEYFQEFLHLYRTHPGISSTFFAVKGKLLQMMFQSLFEKLDLSTAKNFTLDQPFFNRAIVEFAYNRSQFSICFLPKEVFAYNVYKTSANKEACMINMCGDPGEPNIHWIKLFTALLTDS